MILSRILVILCPTVTCAEAEETVWQAQDAAARPASLRFALPDTLQSATLPEGTLFYPIDGGWASAAQLLTDETHFLLLGAPHAFQPYWDARLLRTLRALGSRALLTGSLTPSAPVVLNAQEAEGEEAPTRRMPALRQGLATMRQSLPELQKSLRMRVLPLDIPPARFPDEIPTGSQPCLPALTESIGEDRVRIGRGLPLVCASGPVRTLLADPALLMGPAAFLRDCDLTTDTLSFSAYVGGFSIHALHQAWLWPTREPPRFDLARPSAQSAPGTRLARFEQLLGFRYGAEPPAGKAAMGLFGPEETYAQSLPASLFLPQRARSARMRWRETHMPLLATALIDLPNPRRSAVFYRLHFGFLRRVESLPLLLHTAGSQERALRASFPNCQSYPEQHLLPRSLLQGGMSQRDFFRRSKPLLLLQAAKRQAEFTHAAWVDADILPHPICPQAVPCFEPLMDDRIHLATVNGIPDLSFWVAPVRLLPALARETLSITQLDCELHRGLDEGMLWRRLFQKKPAWFAIHRMPRRRLFFLSLFDPQLLSVPLRTQLRGLPRPYYAKTAEEKADAKESKQP